MDKKQNQLKIFQVDAFTDKVLNGNQAAIIPLKEFFDDDFLLKITQENNVCVTAFIVKNEDKSLEQDYDIKWFTPGGELGLCAHGTQASAWVIYNKFGHQEKEIVFKSNKDILKSVKSENELIALDFPKQEVDKNNIDLNILKEALELQDQDITGIYQSLDYIIVLKSQVQLEKLNPNIKLLKDVKLRGVCITAKNENDQNLDIVSRFFFPKLNIDEDTCSGSGHCQIVPYWLEIFKKTSINSIQVNKTNNRYSKMVCKLDGDRIILSGQARLYMEGNIFI